MKITYVTYDEDGNLTGYYIQELQAPHADHYIELVGYPENFHMQWTFYRANADRTGIELIPVPEPDPE